MEGLDIPPVQLSGSVGEVFRTRQSGDEARSYTNQVTTAVDASSFIWQPWFITLQGALDLAVETQRGGDEDSDSLLAGANAAVGILPFSRYPTTLSYNRTDSRVAGEFTGGDFIRDRFAVASQAVISSDLRTRASASYDTVDQPEFGNEENRQASLFVSKTFTTDALSVGLEYTDSEFVSRSDDEEDESDRSAVASVRYDSTPFENLTSQSSSTFFYTTEESEFQTLDRTSLQGISTAQWRPPDLPFTVNGALRTLTESLDFTGTSSAGDTDTQLAAGTVGLNYPVTPRLNVNLGLSADATSVSRGSGGVAGEAAGASESSAGADLLGNVNYLSLPAPLLGFDWRWNAAAGSTVGFDTVAGFEDSERISLGQFFDRTFDAPLLTPLRFSANQDGTVARDIEDEITPTVTHGVSLAHTSVGEGTSTFLRLSLSDRRDLLVDEGSEFQLAQIQLNRQAQIDLRRNWSGNLSLQYSRQRVAGDPAEELISANGALVYRERDIFDIPDLLFFSELNLAAIGLEEVLIERDRDQRRSETFRSDWRNRFEYRIGRIVTSLEGTLFHNQGRFGNLILFRIRREFGGGFL